MEKSCEEMERIASIVERQTVTSTVVLKDGKILIFGGSQTMETISTHSFPTVFLK